MKRTLCLLLIALISLSSVLTLPAAAAGDTDLAPLSDPSEPQGDPAGDPEEPPAGNPTQPATDPAEPSTEPPTEPPTEAPTQAPANAPTEAPAEPPAPDYPAILSIAPRISGAKITWESYPGAVKYRVFSYVVSTKKWKKLTDVKTTTLTVSGLKNHCYYYFTVRAIGKNGTYISDYQRNVRFTYHDAPVLKSTESVYNGLKITWNAVTGAACYKVYQKVGTSWKPLGFAAGTSYTDTNVTAGSKHTYSVRVFAVDRVTGESYYDTKGLTTTFVAAPEMTALTPGANGFVLKWSASQGASKYRVFFKDNGKWVKLADTAALTYSHCKLTDSKKYTYTVRAMDAKNRYMSGFRPEGWTATFYLPPALTVEPDESGARLSWEDKAGVVTFRVYRKTYGGAWMTLADIPGASYVDMDCPDIPCTYTLRYYDAQMKPLSHYLNGDRYYDKGTPADGKYRIDDTALTFSDGVVCSGYVTRGGKLYYYNASGVILKNQIVGSEKEGYAFADADGVCCKDEQLTLAIDFVRQHATGKTNYDKLASAFMYLAKYYPYERDMVHPKKASDIPRQALDMFRNKRGNCYKYGAALACIAKVLGYRSRAVIGNLPQTQGNPMDHGWTEIYMDGRWYIFDANAQMQEPQNTLKFFKMSKHIWYTVVENRFELTVSSGKVVWK